MATLSLPTVGDLLMSVIITSPGELGTAALGVTLELWVAVLRPLVVEQVGLRHKLSVTVWLRAREGLLPTVHRGQVPFEFLLGSKLLATLWALVCYDSFVNY